jgi:hypothetical protein
MCVVDIVWRKVILLQSKSEHGAPGARNLNWDEPHAGTGRINIHTHTLPPRALCREMPEGVMHYAVAAVC